MLSAGRYDCSTEVRRLVRPSTPRRACASRCGSRSPKARAHLGHLGVDGVLCRAVGGRGRPRVPGLVACREQDGLLVLGLHPVHQPRHLRAVPHQPGRGGRAGRLPHQVREEVRQQAHDDRGGDADEQVELAAEGPAVGERPCYAPVVGVPGGCVHLDRGHRASFMGVWSGETSVPRHRGGPRAPLRSTANSLDTTGLLRDRSALLHQESVTKRPLSVHKWSQIEANR